MLHSQYRWDLPGTDPAAAETLAQQLNVSKLLASLLMNRGITTVDAAKAFLYSTHEQMHDPFLLRGMKEAVDRIRLALEREEHILIYGDYDADGVSSTALMIYLMRHLGASFDIYIPHRSNEGYGLHNHALDWAMQQGVSLVVTVDTGISAVEQIAYANSLGIDVVVTDHHEPPEILPEAYTLVNPKLPDCPYPFKGLAGVGVALKLAQAMLGEVPEAWYEIASIGTIADLMPLQGENRYIVKTGLESMRRTSFPGIAALLSVGGIEIGAVTSVNVAFAMAPRINASGRLDHAGRAVSLLTTEHQDEAERLASELDLLNKERQRVVQEIVDEAINRVEQRVQAEGLPDVIVVAGEGWNVGVVGIVASKLLERYYRATIILGIDASTGMCKGSARSIPGLDIYEALSSCKDLMEHFGGHPAAAGMALHSDQLSAFDTALNQFAAVHLKPEHYVPVMEVDGVLQLEETPLAAVEELELLQPFGMDNPTPRFLLQGAAVQETRRMGRERNHLKLQLNQKGRQLDVVAFGRGALADYLEPKTALDVVGELTINEWNGNRKLQLMLQDLRMPEMQVFDLRDSRDPAGEVQRCLQELKPYMGREHTWAGVVREGSYLLNQGNSLNEQQLWVYDKHVGVRPLNPEASRESLSSVQTLFVLELPETMEQLLALLSDCSAVENLFLLYSRQDAAAGRLEKPSRESFKRVYILLSKLGPNPVSERDILPALSRQCSLSVRMLSKALDVFAELGFVERNGGQISFVSNPPKRDLEDSRHYQELGHLAEMEQYLLHENASNLTRWMMERTQGVS
ncbi:single-stranded-DNA-specific exonuclease RecJ [Paenibacillus sp. JX-17]|uniref:Single-stranded-DNA-specific exonuclease RecJ n=1 Tax=Paenibacillus lacisoli TaxID=3064525 RepID=A0ABT9CFN8_9BACL|nr:single-stranded-DNA-specific exonuclease RecJ [Paenibacillus sp. JX-17]MDO7908090.1 single-stranded-DNA-specific exonuclease RecJ [Paenibacillus sp. JX-17]